MRKEYEMETRCKKAKTALDRFFKKYPECEEWKEHLGWMADNGVDFSSDDKMADGTKNLMWSWAIHFDQNEDNYYICIITRFDDGEDLKEWVNDMMDYRTRFSENATIEDMVNCLWYAEDFDTDKYSKEDLRKAIEERMVEA